MTVRYCRPGALIGVMSLFASEFAMPGTTQALLDAELLKIFAHVVGRLAERDVRVARAFLSELSERASSFIQEILRQRFRLRAPMGSPSCARPCLRARSRGRRGGTRGLGQQQELADAVGTVREVVVRVLRELRQEGPCGRSDRIVLMDPVRLIDEQSGT
jgi:CRP/FNR family transcriptional regulator